MKAAVYKGKQRFEVEEITTPSPGPSRVLLKIHYRGAVVEMGADDVIDPSREDATERMVEPTGGIGPEVIVDWAGVQAFQDLIAVRGPAEW